MMSTRSAVVLPNIHDRESILSPKRIQNIPKEKLIQVLKAKARKSSSKLQYLFEKEHVGNKVEEAQLLKERQKVFLRVHQIIKHKLKRGSIKNNRAFQSPRRLRKVLKSPTFRYKE